MPDTDANSHSDCFAAAPLDEAVDRLVELLRRHRPQVVVTYPDDHGGYNHPDHVRVHDITGPAVEQAADPDHRPDLGEPWTVSKIYYSVWSRARFEARHQAFIDHGLESPYEDRWFKRPNQDDKITTRVSIEGFADVRREALLAHATQIDPESPFWFGLPIEIDRAIHPYDEYMLAQGATAGELPEDDLFAGIRSATSAR